MSGLFLHFSNLSRRQGCQLDVFGSAGARTSIKTKRKRVTICIVFFSFSSSHTGIWFLRWDEIRSAQQPAKIELESVQMQNMSIERHNDDDQLPYLKIHLSIFEWIIISIFCVHFPAFVFDLWTWDWQIDTSMAVCPIYKMLMRWQSVLSAGFVSCRM